MFNRKIVKALEKRVEELQEKLKQEKNGNIILRQESSHRNSMSVRRNEQAKSYPIPVQGPIPLDVIQFAKQLQMQQRGQICGQGPCRMIYKVPVEMIDRVANATPASRFISLEEYLRVVNHPGTPEDQQKELNDILKSK